MLFGITNLVIMAMCSVLPLDSQNFFGQEIVRKIFLEKYDRIFVLQVFKVTKVGLDDRLLVLGENGVLLENLRVEKIAIYKIFDVYISIYHHEQGFVKAVTELSLTIRKLKKTLDKWLNAEDWILSEGSFNGIVPRDIFLIHVHFTLASMLLRVTFLLDVMHDVFDLVIHNINKSFIYFINIRLNDIDVKWKQRENTCSRKFLTRCEK